ncbi:MAG: NACHT domain-containing protein [Pseudonocardiaceae bacterium]
MIDLRPMVARQADRLANDSIYPTQLYVPQRYRLLDDAPDAAARDDLLGRVIEWLSADNARFVMVLGDFGRGKTFLLRELASTLPQHLPGLLPVLAELRSLEKAPSLDELLAQYLVRQNVDDLDVKKLRYMIRSGRLVLLFDGFDELELRVGFNNAADYLNTLLRAVTGNAKVVLTSRTQHFGSTAQIRTALGAQVTALPASRVAVLEDFSKEQILQFLAKHYGGDIALAHARFALLDDVHDLLGLSRNPRMLSFIANLDERRLRAVQKEHGQISAAELYRELVYSWLLGEAGRQHHRAGLPSLDAAERLHACTALALRLWTTTALTIPVTELTVEVSATLTNLVERGFTAAQAAHTVGSGTLLVRTPDDEFAFVHQSVMEWLVAQAAAEKLQEGLAADTLLTRTMSALMLDFLCDLAGHDVARRWATEALADSAASDVAKRNGLAIAQRLGPGIHQNLANVDLRGEDLANRDLRNANMEGADLRGMRLVGTNLANANLSHADFTGARVVKGDLTGAQVAGSRWKHAALLDVAGVDDLVEARELDVVAVAGRDPAEVMLAPTGDVFGVAFSVDSTLLAASYGHSVVMIDLVSGDSLRVLGGHTGKVTAVAFSSDGALIASASRDETARVWDPVTGHLCTILKGHTSQVWGVAFSPRSTLIATASWDRTARIWNPTTGRLNTILEGHSSQVWGVAFSPDGALIATASWDRTARIWESMTGQLRVILKGHTGGVTAVAFSPDGTLIATASDDRTARVWDPITGHLRTILKGHTGGITAVAFSSDGTMMATTSSDGTAQIWDAATGEHRTTLKGHTSKVWGVAFSPKDSLIATASDDETAQIWDAATGDHRTTLKGHTNQMWGMAFSPDGALIATASEDGTARVWDAATGQHRTILTGHTGGVTAVAFSPRGALIATASEDRTARVWDAATGQHRTILTGHTSGVTAVAFSPDGALIATASEDGTAQVWDTTTDRRRNTLTGHSDSVTAVTFSLHTALIATASWDGTIRVWSVTTGHLRNILAGHTNGVTAVAFSPDGTLIATASHDETARIWDPNTGLHRILQGHTSGVTAVAFSPDGTLIATASHDGTARIWDPAGVWLASLLAVEAGGYAVLLPDGSYKLNGDPDRSLWWAIKLCRFAPSELDPYDSRIRQLPDDAPIPRRPPQSAARWSAESAGMVGEPEGGGAAGTG